MYVSRSLSISEYTEFLLAALNGDTIGEAVTGVSCPSHDGIFLRSLRTREFCLSSVYRRRIYPYTLCKYWEVCDSECPET
jgi:hypothetical protein